MLVLVLECRGNCFNQKRAVNLPATALDSGMVSPPHFDHEKLDVYQLELKFLSWVTPFLADLSSRSLAPTGELQTARSHVISMSRRFRK